MNRAERRRNGINEPEKSIMIKTSDIERIKQEAAERATNTAITLMLGIPLLVLHDKYSEITRKEVNGKSRLERFAEMCLFQFDCFNEGRLKIDDFHKIIWNEAGIRLECNNGDKPFIEKNIHKSR